MRALDRLARGAAEIRPNGDATLTRRDLARRGLLGLVALGLSSPLAMPVTALGAGSACRSLKTCLENAEKTAWDAFLKCYVGDADRVSIPKHVDYVVERIGCRLWTYQPLLREKQRECLAKCPPPPKGPPPKRPPRRAPAPPPPLPPNPYAPISDACAACSAVGGVCCYGNDPKALCACANPDYDCASKYGCG